MQLRNLRNMAQSLRDQQTSMEQLSTGKRINSAMDDPAGLQVATKQSARIRSLQQAQNNVNQIIDLLQLTDAGLDGISNIIIRMRELCLTAANGTLGDPEREALQQEYRQLRSELDHIAKSTKFNDIRLLSQVHMDIGFIIDTSGSMAGEIAQVRNSIDSFAQKFEDAEVDVQFGLGDMNAARDSQDSLLKVNDTSVPGFKSALAGLTTQGGAVDPYSALVNASGTNDFNNDNDDFTWRNVEKHLIVITDTYQEIQKIPGQPSQGEVARDLADDGVTVHAINRAVQDGHYSTLVNQTGGSQHDIGNNNGSGIPTALESIADNLVGTAWPPARPIEVQAGINDTDDDHFQTGAPVDATSVALGIRTLRLTTQQSALDALAQLDQALSTVSAKRGEVGAMVNRMHHTVSYHLVAIENEAGARSRIEDADVAVASATLARSTILTNMVVSLWAQIKQMRKDAVFQLLAGTFGQVPRA